MGKSRAGKNRIEMGDSSGGGFERSTIGADLFGELGENAGNLCDFFFGKLNEAIIEIDGFERLDKDSLTCRAGSVDDAGNGAAIAGADRNDEAIVAERDVVFADRLATSAKDAFEGFLYFVTGLSRCRCECGAIAERRRR